MPPGEQAGVLGIAASSANWAGHYVSAEHYARRVLALREAEGDPASVARATASVAMILKDAGRVADAIPMLEDALARLPESQSPEAEAALRTYLSRAYYLTGRNEECLASADRALTLAEPLGLDDLVAEALVNKAGALNDLHGHRREAVALYEGVIRLAHASGLIDAELRARNNLGCHLADDDKRRALTVWRKGFELAKKLGWFAVALRTNVAGALVDTATDWDEALRSVEELLATDLEPGNRYALEDSVILLLAARGEVGDDWFAAHERLVQGLADPQRSAQLENGRACVAWCRGDYEAAVRAGLAQAEFRSLNVGDLHGLLNAFRGALWLRDLPGVRSLAERIEEDPQRTPVAEAPGLSLAVGWPAWKRGPRMLWPTSGRRSDAGKNPGTTGLRPRPPSTSSGQSVRRSRRRARRQRRPARSSSGSAPACTSTGSTR